MSNYISELTKSGKITFRHTSTKEDSVIVTGDCCPKKTDNEDVLPDDYTNILDNGIQELFNKGNLVIINLECPLTESTYPITKTGPSLKAAPYIADLISTLNIDIVDLANNHILDYGNEGLLDTINYCSKNGLKCVGAGKDIESARESLFIDVGTTRLAILAGTEREFSIADDKSPGACPVDPLVDRTRLREAGEKADVVIYIFHGGNEYNEYPSPWMRDYCRYLIETGADAVICHHAHVISGVEIFQGSPIIYGTGNFLFPWPTERPEAWYYGYLVKLNLCNQAISSMEIRPYSQCIDGELKVTSLSGKDLESTLRKIAKISTNIITDSIFQTKWEEFCNSKSLSYISSILQLTKFERIIYAKTGILIRKDKKFANLLRLMNIIRCESHRAALLEILEKELAGME